MTADTLIKEWYKWHQPVNINQQYYLPGGEVHKLQKCQEFCTTSFSWSQGCGVLNQRTVTKFDACNIVQIDKKRPMMSAEKCSISRETWTSLTGTDRLLEINISSSIWLMQNVKPLSSGKKKMDVVMFDRTPVDQKWLTIFIKLIKVKSHCR